MSADTAAFAALLNELRGPLTGVAAKYRTFVERLKAISPVEAVAKLQQLTTLGLDNTQITDAGLKELAEVHKLKYLVLIKTKVTKEGVAELKKALPNCKIYGP